MATTNKARDNAYMGLYRAVAKYVRLKGGSVVVCSGIQVQEWPGSGKWSFSIAVKCLGRKPIYAKEQANEQRTVTSAD